jgi:hypothetical protein
VVTALGLEPALQRAEDHFRKGSILPRQPLEGLSASALPSFKIAPPDSPFIDHHADDTVGTDDLVMLRLQEANAMGMEGQVILLVTYYSDPDDRVPHTPEVCYRQIGGMVEQIGELPVVLSTTAEVEREDAQREITARKVIVDEKGVSAVIGYVFCANGEFMTTRNAVRLALRTPGYNRVYFAKIEAVTPSAAGSDHEVALARCRRLLSEAIPQLLDVYFPTLADLKTH